MTDELKPVPCGCGGEVWAFMTLYPENSERPYICQCRKCFTRTGGYPTEAEAVTAWNKAMSAERIEWLAEYATGLQTEPERTAKVNYELTSSRIYLVNDAVGQFHPVCGNCEALVAKGWQYCPKCGARLFWGNI